MKPLKFLLRKISWVGILGFIVLLSACATHERVPCQSVALNYGEFCSQQTQCKLITALRNDGVSVYFYGDNIYLFVLTQNLFGDRQTFVKPDGGKVLDDIARLLSCYQKVSVRVTGFSGDLTAKEENIVLSKQQADAVVEYLWSKCIKARVIYARGGAIAAFNQHMSGQNHIMIETRRLP